MESFIGWIGGKRQLRKEIVAHFPEEKLKKYVEVFGGAAWVLFYREKHAEQEIYNDMNSELVNLFRCVKYHRAELQRELQHIFNSREMFFDFMAQYQTRGMTDIQRAVRYFMLVKTSYGSDVQSFGCVRKDVKHMIEYLEAIETRLQKVVIEHSDFERILKTYDKNGTLFYLDPPYYSAEKYYQYVEFSLDDHRRLCECLSNIKCKFILSYNDHPEIRKLYKGFDIVETCRNNNLTSKIGAGTYNELIIKNY